MRKNVFVTCKAGGYIGNKTQNNESTEVLLPTEYSNYAPKDALCGDDDDNNVLLPTFMNGWQHDTPEGLHGENSRTM